MIGVNLGNLHPSGHPVGPASACPGTPRAPGGHTWAARTAMSGRRCRLSSSSTARPGASWCWHCCRSTTRFGSAARRLTRWTFPSTGESTGANVWPWSTRLNSPTTPPSCRSCTPPFPLDVMSVITTAGLEVVKVVQTSGTRDGLAPSHRPTGRDGNSPTESSPVHSGAGLHVPLD
jgi:hypothetical protein